MRLLGLLFGVPNRSLPSPPVMPDEIDITVPIIFKLGASDVILARLDP